MSDSVCTPCKTIIKKSNNFLSIARFDLSTQEQKLLLFLIGKIDASAEAFGTIHFDCREFCSACDISSQSKNYADFMGIIKKLADNSFWIACDGSVELHRWLCDVRISIHRNGLATVRFDPFLAPYLLNLKKNYFQFPFENVARMRSKYSIRLYELLRANLYIGKFRVNPHSLFEYLNISATRSFHDFRQSILERSMAEICTHTDIDVSVSYTRSGRSVSEVVFAISPKEASNS